VSNDNAADAAAEAQLRLQLIIERPQSRRPPIGVTDRIAIQRVEADTILE